MIIIIGMGLVIQFQILDRAVYVSLCTKAIGKSMNLSFFLLAMYK